MEYDPEGQFLALVLKDGAINIWDVVEGICSKRIPHLARNVRFLLQLCSVCTLDALRTRCHDFDTGSRAQ